MSHNYVTHTPITTDNKTEMKLLSFDYGEVI